MCRLGLVGGLVGMRNALGFPEELVAIACPQPLGEDVFPEGERGTAVPLPKSAVSAPWRPSHAGPGNASRVVVPKTVKFGVGVYGNLQVHPEVPTGILFQPSPPPPPP